MTSNPIVILGFDFGMKHIGVAVGQSITQTATPLLTLSAKDGIPLWEDIEKLIQKWQPHVLVVGIPLNMDGSEQPMTHAAKRFKNRLHEKCKLPVYPVDERLSTWEIKQQHPDIKKDIATLNAKAAALLVEQWIRDNMSILKSF